MSVISDFLQKTKDDYDKFEADLAVLEKKAEEEGKKADAWNKEQLARLRTELAEARAEVDQFFDRVKHGGEEAATDIQDQVERHWEAMQVAVDAYRKHIESEDKDSGAT